MKVKDYKLVSKYKPTGDQPKAISELVKGIKENKKNQVLLGVTGSGKTFTIANVISQFNKPVIILSHNKTLASQLYSELKGFFPNNRVEYFVSYFDYYRPEAYLPQKDVYVDKTSKTNQDLEAMRMASLNALTMRRDSIVVASVAAIYGSVNPEEYKSSIFNIEVGMVIKRNHFFINLIKRQYKRNNVELSSGCFSVKGDVIELAPAWTSEYLIRVVFFGDEIESIVRIEPLTKKITKSFNGLAIFPAAIYAVQDPTIHRAVNLIKHELEDRLEYFKSNGKLLEYQRLHDRTINDIDSLLEFGYCPGIENYSRHIDGRSEGEKPFTILDYLPEDALVIIDESHMMIPQLNAMYRGDRARKENLVDYGFRLPSALDNRPLRFDEFEKYEFQKIFVSATPGNYEIDLVEGEIISQIIRPTGLIDPTIEVYPSENQIENIYDRIQEQIKKNEKTFILTTTKRTSEELTKHFQTLGVKIAYIHSDHKTLERNEILRKLRKGVYDVVIGINLLREGIDIPEVSLILVLDADKESFFRSTRSLIQITGRAARNVNGHVVFYADGISKSMQETIDDNAFKRGIQEKYNKANNITPQTIVKPIPEPIQGHDLQNAIDYVLNQKNKKAKKSEVIKIIEGLRVEMREAAKKLEFERATEIRDMIFELEAEL
ncbi:MAG: excinuclease ABC subunit UvrB [Metamycoplasmataceae bacterium]